MGSRPLVFVANRVLPAPLLRAGRGYRISLMIRPRVESSKGSNLLINDYLMGNVPKTGGGGKAASQQR